MRTKKLPKPDDVAIGARIRARRMTLAISQEQLGATLGISFQQIQKYEKGTNRIGGSRMIQISTALKAPVSFFFGEGKDAVAVATLRDFDRLDFAIASEAAGLDAAAKHAVLTIIRTIRQATEMATQAEPAKAAA